MTVAPTSYILSQYAAIGRGVMSKDAVFTMKLDAELRSEFMAQAVDEDRPASQIVRELMREYIEQRRHVREYDSYLRDKVDAGRAAMLAGRGRSHAEIEQEFAARRTQVPADDA